MRKIFTAALIAAAMIFAAAPAYAQQAYKFPYPMQKEIQQRLDVANNFLNSRDNTNPDENFIVDLMIMGQLVNLNADDLMPMVRNASPKQKQAVLDYVKTVTEANKKLYEGLLGQ